MNNSTITCDEIIELYNEETKKINEEKAAFKTQNFYILLAFLLITIALLTAVSIYCYLIKIEQNKNIYYNFATQN